MIHTKTWTKKTREQKHPLLFSPSRCKPEWSNLARTSQINWLNRRRRRRASILFYPRVSGNHGLSRHPPSPFPPSPDYHGTCNLSPTPYFSVRGFFPLSLSLSLSLSPFLFFSLCSSFRFQVLIRLQADVTRAG